MYQNGNSSRSTSTSLFKPDLSITRTWVRFGGLLALRPQKEVNRSISSESRILPLSSTVLVEGGSTSTSLGILASFRNASQPREITLSVMKPCRLPMRSSGPLFEITISSRVSAAFFRNSPHISRALKIPPQYGEYWNFRKALGYPSKEIMPSALYAALCSSKLLSSELRLERHCRGRSMSSSVVERLRMLGN